MTSTSTSTRTGVTVSGMARTPGWRVVPALIAALIVLIPLAYLAIRAGEIPFDRVVGVLFESRALDYTLNTLALAVSVALSVLLGGVAIAVGMSRGRFPRPKLWLVLAALPLAIPSYLASYGWLVWLMSPRGIAPASTASTIGVLPSKYCGSLVLRPLTHASAAPSPSITR